jgi:hypothetical protein
VSPDEVRDKIQHDPDSGYNNLSGDAPGPPEMELMQAQGEIDAENAPEPKGAEDDSLGWTLPRRMA